LEICPEPAGGAISAPCDPFTVLGERIGLEKGKKKEVRKWEGMRGEGVGKGGKGKWGGNGREGRKKGPHQV